MAKYDQIMDEAGFQPANAGMETDAGGYSFSPKTEDIEASGLTQALAEGQRAEQRARAMKYELEALLAQYPQGSEPPELRSALDSANAALANIQAAMASRNPSAIFSASIQVGNSYNAGTSAIEEEVGGMVAVDGVYAYPYDMHKMQTYNYSIAQQYNIAGINGYDAPTQQFLMADLNQFFVTDSQLQSSFIASSLFDTNPTLSEIKQNKKHECVSGEAQLRALGDSEINSILDQIREQNKENKLDGFITAEIWQKVESGELARGDIASALREKMQERRQKSQEGLNDVMSQMTFEEQSLLTQMTREKFGMDASTPVTHEDMIKLINESQPDRALVSSAAYKTSKGETLTPEEKEALALQKAKARLEVKQIEQNMQELFSSLDDTERAKVQEQMYGLLQEGKTADAMALLDGLNGDKPLPEGLQATLSAMPPAQQKQFMQDLLTGNTSGAQRSYETAHYMIDSGRTLEGLSAQQIDALWGEGSVYNNLYYMDPETGQTVWNENIVFGFTQSATLDALVDQTAAQAQTASSQGVPENPFAVPPAELQPAVVTQPAPEMPSQFAGIKLPKFFDTNGFPPNPSDMSYATTSGIPPQAGLPQEGVARTNSLSVAG